MVYLNARNISLYSQDILYLTQSCSVRRQEQHATLLVEREVVKAKFAGDAWSLTRKVGAQDSTESVFFTQYLTVFLDVQGNERSGVPIRTGFDALTWSLAGREDGDGHAPSLSGNASPRMGIRPDGLVVFESVGSAGEAKNASSLWGSSVSGDVETQREVSP